MALYNSKLKDSQKATTAASAAVQVYVAAILEQGTMELKEMPDLLKHQETARMHAVKWNVAVLPGMANTLANIIGYANQFNVYYTNLAKLADKVASDSDAREKFIEGLTQLRNSISRKVADSKSVKTSLITFNDNLQADYTTFKDDAAKATKLYEGKSGEIAKLSGDIDQAQKSMDTDIGVMAGGAVGIVAGTIVIVVGAVAEIPTASVSTGLIVGGVGMMVTGITSEIVGGVQYALTVKKLVSLKEKLKEDKLGFMGVKTVEGQLDGLVNQLNNAIAAVNSLTQQWSDLYDSLEQVIKDVDEDPGTYGPQVKSMLDKASQDWHDALSFSLKLQPNGQLKVQKYPKIQDAIHVGS